MIEPSAITLLPWDESGLALLRSLNTPEEKRYLGGPESEEKLLERHARYLTYHKPGEVEVLQVASAGETVGAVVYWEREEAGETVYEAGWELLPRMQGRGVGTAATAAMLSRLQPLARHGYVYATPTPDNAASNGICRKLGFTLIGTADVEYPQGTVSPHNIWRLDLTQWSPPAA
ncbi:MAG TPA: GNAT family protein [Devosia sp.]|nr:GNAT family protein [Devosia sp.]